MEENSLQSEIQLTNYQSLLFPYAYNILGDAMQAEDIVQDVLIKYFTTDHKIIEHEKAYLIKSVINRSINFKQLLRVKNETYPGQWLPEPVATESDIYSKADRQHILNYSLLLLLEKLNPKERGVFILKESFEHTHEEIAEILSITTSHSRQLLKRAKEKIAGDMNVQTTKLSPPDQEILKKLTAAIAGIDIEQVKQILADDVRLFADGGKHISASRNIIYGKDRGAKLLHGIWQKFTRSNTEIKLTMVNHMPALLFSEAGEIYRCVIFEPRGDQIGQIFIMVNPEKLNHFLID